MNLPGDEKPVIAANALASNRGLALNTRQQAELCRGVLATYQRWKQARSGLEATWRACWHAYLGKPDLAQRESFWDMEYDRSLINRPVLFEAVETIHANLLNALFPSGERFFTVEAASEKDKNASKWVEHFLRQKLEESSFIDRFAAFLKQAILIGNSVAAVSWQRDVQSQIVHEPVEVLGLPVGVKKTKKEVVLYEGPDFAVVDMADFYIDPAASTFDEAMVMHRVERSLHELQEAGVYSNLTLLRDKQEAMQVSEKSTRRLSEKAEPTGLTGGSNRYALLEVWGDFELDGLRYANYVAVVSLSGLLLRFEPNPYECGRKPFIFTTFIGVPNEIYGMGAIQQSLGLQHAINTLTNQKLDVINLAINCPFTYVINDDVFDPLSLVTRPGALIPVKSHDTLRPLQQVQDYTVAFQEIADLKAEVQEATGAFKYFTGASNETVNLGKRTATEVTALLQGGSQKFSSLLAHIEHNALEAYMRLAFALCRQFIRSETPVRYTNTQGETCYNTLLPYVLQSTNCGFRISGSKALLANNQEVEAIASFLRLVYEFPALHKQVNTMELLKRVYRRLGFKDEADIFQALPAEGNSPAPEPASG